MFITVSMIPSTSVAKFITNGSAVEAWKRNKQRYFLTLVSFSCYTYVNFPYDVKLVARFLTLGAVSSQISQIPL